VNDQPLNLKFGDRIVFGTPAAECFFSTSLSFSTGSNTLFRYIDPKHKPAEVAFCRWLLQLPFCATLGQNELAIVDFDAAQQELANARGDLSKLVAARLLRDWLMNQSQAAKTTGC